MRAISRRKMLVERRYKPEVCKDLEPVADPEDEVITFKEILLHLPRDCSGSGWHTHSRPRYHRHKKTRRGIPAGGSRPVCCFPIDQVVDMNDVRSIPALDSASWVSISELIPKPLMIRAFSGIISGPGGHPVPGSRFIRSYEAVMV